MLKGLKLSFLFSSFWFFSLVSYGQKYKTVFSIKASEEVKPSASGYKTYDFRFININKVLRYTNPKLVKEINGIRFEIESDPSPAPNLAKVAKIASLMEEYVRNWGIQNFYYETQYLWDLGRYYELLGDKSRAFSMYRLAIKHHKGNAVKYRRYFDSVAVNQNAQYVPLKFYYELVEYRKNIDTLVPPRGVLLNMGETVNSPAPDYGPSLSRNDDTLIFSSKRRRKRTTGKQNEDLYMSKNFDGFWDDATPITSINTDYNEGSAVLSKNGKHLYFSRCDAPGGFGSCDIYVADWLTNNPDSFDKWGNIRNLGAGVNGNAWDSHPALSFTEDTLFFASNRLGGFGGSDLYFSVKNKEENFGPAQNLGPIINTRYNEVSPCVHAAQKVLYFSSDGQMLNFGDLEIYGNKYRAWYDNLYYDRDPTDRVPGVKAERPNTFDIFKSYLREGHYQEPKNIGPLVNGKGDEYYFTIDSKSNKLYYARSEDTTIANLDIFSFPLPMEAQPLATTALAGKLTDSTGKPFEGIVSIIDLDRGVEVSPQQLRADGSFNFDLIKDNNYLLVIQGEQFFRIQQFFKLKGDTTIERKTSSIRNTKISFASIVFEENSNEVLPGMYEDLENVKNFLIDNPRFKLNISGHTDKLGKQLDNVKLSQARADAIKAFLTGGGQVKAVRIESKGMGSDRPIIQVERNEADRKVNRRVEFEIVLPVLERIQNQAEEDKKTPNSPEGKDSGKPTPE